MAKHLARIHGTEEDKVNCPFYFKIGACRHADRCSRLHHKPAFSPTLLIKHLYRHPLAPQQQKQDSNNNEDGQSNGNSNSNNSNYHNNKQHQPPTSPEQQMEDFLCFFEDMYMELSKFGKLEGLHVCDNLGDHMIGHVYVKYYDEEDAADALGVLNGRYYDGIQMNVEYSPVTDFREARCRDYDEDTCSRGGFCNFLHAKPVPIPLLRSLEDDAEDDRQRHLYNANNRGNRNSSKKRSSSSSGRGDGTKRKRDKKSSKSHRKSSSSGEKRRSRSNSESSTSTNNNNDDDGDTDKTHMNEENEKQEE